MSGSDTATGTPTVVPVRRPGRWAATAVGLVLVGMVDDDEGLAKRLGPAAPPI